MSFELRQQLKAHGSELITSNMPEEKEKWLKTRMIIEIAGTPKEHIEQTIVLLGEKFCEGAQDVKVTKTSVREPVQLPDSNVWSGFLEFEADVKDLPTLLGIIFDYLPSSIEILAPEELATQTAELNGLLNDLAAKLHKYDSMVKVLKAKVALLKKELARKASNNP